MGYAERVFTATDAVAVVCQTCYGDYQMASATLLGKEPDMMRGRRCTWSYMCDAKARRSLHVSLRFLSVPTATSPQSLYVC